MVFDNERQRDIRRGILFVLRAMPDCRINDDVIREALRAGGHDLTKADVCDHLMYLASDDKKYISLRRNREIDIMVAQITGKGRDLVDGVISDPGVSLEGDANGIPA